MTELSKEEHKIRHKKLHKMLDELIADYMRHTEKFISSDSTLRDLMEWSYKQTMEPIE